jgi:hypothetical protein|tara:strand:- start:413 stop:688 length:276 start_codon:yes stop_codon:yes gene_type:complete
VEVEVKFDIAQHLKDLEDLEVVEVMEVAQYLLKLEVQVILLKLILIKEIQEEVTLVHHQELVVVGLQQLDLLVEVLLETEEQVELEHQTQY